MADVVANQVGGSFGDANDAQKNVFDLGAFVGDLTFEEDASGDDISFEGLAKELEECKNYDVVENILSKGTTLREYTKGVENDLRQVEMDSIQMETHLSGFQVAESKLAKFVEDIIIPPRMVDIIVDGEVNEEYMTTPEILSKKLKFIEVDLMVKTSKAHKDVWPELEKLRQKTVSKVFDFIAQKLYILRKPKTNIQILQQNVLLKYKYVISFPKEHGKEVYNEVSIAYIDAMNKEIDQPALIPHISEASSLKYPHEVLFRSLHKQLMDTATSEYLFCDDFLVEESIFYEIFAAHHVSAVDPMLGFIFRQVCVMQM